MGVLSWNLYVTEIHDILLSQMVWSSLNVSTRVIIGLRELEVIISNFLCLSDHIKQLFRIEVIR
jgi:hypothetical protein